MFTQEEINKMKSWAANQGYDNVSDAEAIQILYDIASKDPESPYYNTINSNKKTINPNDVKGDSEAKTNTTSITDSITTDSTNTINGTTTEDQAPTQDSGKGGSTINLDPSEKGEDIKITELGNVGVLGSDKEPTKPENIRHPEASQAYKKYIELLNNSIGENKVNEITAASRLKSDINNADEILTDMYWDGVSKDVIGDLAAIEKGIKSGQIKNEGDITSFLSDTRIPQLTALLAGIGQKVGVKGLGKILGSIGKAASENLGATVYTLMAAAENIGEAMNGKVNITNTGFWGGLGNSAMNMLDNLTMNAISGIMEKKGIRPFWYNTEEDEAKYKAQKIFQKSNTYKGTTDLEKYGADEEQLASTLMVDALAVMNRYNLFGGPVNQEAFYEVFQYDPVSHNRFRKDDGATLFDVIQAVSDQDALNTQK